MKHWRGLRADFVGCRFEASLLANALKLYAMGFRSPVKRSTLADANESLGVYVDFARPYTLHRAGPSKCRWRVELPSAE